MSITAAEKLEREIRKLLMINVSGRGDHQVWGRIVLQMEG